MYQLEVVPQWHEEGFDIPVEVKVGTVDSQKRFETDTGSVEESRSPRVPHCEWGTHSDSDQEGKALLIVTLKPVSH